MDPFRHQSLLDLHATQRVQKQGELAEALGMLQTLARRRAELVAQQRELQGQVRAIHSAGRLDVRPLVELQRFEQVLRVRLEGLTNEVENWEAEATRRRATLEQAELELKVWRQLEKRHFRQQRLRQQRLDVQQLDEIGVQGLHS